MNKSPQMVLSLAALHTKNPGFSYSHTFSDSGQDSRVQTNAQVERSDVWLLWFPFVRVSFLRNTNASEKLFGGFSDALMFGCIFPSILWRFTMGSLVPKNGSSLRELTEGFKFLGTEPESDIPTRKWWWWREDLPRAAHQWGWRRKGLFRTDRLSEVEGENIYCGFTARVNLKVEVVQLGVALEWLWKEFARTSFH
jgi:hypothetical protein